MSWQPLVAREPVVEPNAAVGRDVQAELAAPVQDVLGGDGPLLATQVVDLAGVHAGQHLLAELGDRARTPQDPLGFSDQKRYRDRLKSTLKNTGLKDAFVSGVGLVGDVPVSIGRFAFEFMGGSMGSVVGEKVTRVFDRAYERRIADLEQALAAKGQENRELIQAKIQLIRHQMESERTRNRLEFN